MCALQVGAHALVLVSLFRQQTRAQTTQTVRLCLHGRIPWVCALPER
jgi:hypothetical protein